MHIDRRYFAIMLDARYNMVLSAGCWLYYRPEPVNAWNELIPFPDAVEELESYLRII